MAFSDVTSTGGGGSGGGSGGGGGGTPSVAYNIQGLTADYTAVAADDGKYFTNLGASGLITITLPLAPVIGYNITAVSAEAQSSSTMAFAPTGSDRIQTVQSAATSAQKMGCTNSGRSMGCVLQLSYVGSSLWTFTGGYPYDWNQQ